MFSIDTGQLIWIVGIVVATLSTTVAYLFRIITQAHVEAINGRGAVYDKVIASKDESLEMAKQFTQITVKALGESTEAIGANRIAMVDAVQQMRLSMERSTNEHVRLLEATEKISQSLTAVARSSSNRTREGDAKT